MRLAELATEHRYDKSFASPLMLAIRLFGILRSPAGITTCVENLLVGFQHFGDAA
jgi:hypothetical protein